jgi:biopolymer transport protein ExbD
MRKFLQENSQEEVDIDITPMLDVVFIMLIFFIVTASFVKEAGLDISKPEASQSSEPAEIKPIVIYINALDEMRVGNRRIDARSIKPTVVRMIAESPGAVIVIQADKQSTTKAVVQAVDGVRAARGPKSSPPIVKVKE